MAVSDGWVSTQVLADALRLQRSAIAASIVCAAHKIQVSRDGRWLCGVTPYCTWRANLFERMARAGIDRLDALQRELQEDPRWGVPPSAARPLGSADSGDGDDCRGSGQDEEDQHGRGRRGRRPNRRRSASPEGEPSLERSPRR